MYLSPPGFLLQEIEALHTDMVNAQRTVRVTYCTSGPGLHSHADSYDLQWLVIPQCGYWGRHWLLRICSCTPSLFTLQRATRPLQLTYMYCCFNQLISNTLSIVYYSQRILQHCEKNLVTLHHCILDQGKSTSIVLCCNILYIHAATLLCIYKGWWASVYIESMYTKQVM